MSREKLVELKNRVTFIRESHNLSKTLFAERLGISGAYVTDLESGKNKNISKTLAKLIFYEFGFNPEWTLTGKGDIYIENKSPSDIVSEKIMLMLTDMDDVKRRDVLKYTEERKQLSDLLKGKKKKQAG